MMELNLREFEITKDRIFHVIQDLYYEIGSLLASEGLNEEQRESLYGALDEGLNGAKGVMVLMTDLMGDNLSLVENPTTGLFTCVKSAEVDPEIVYEQVNALIREINTVLNRELCFA